MKNLYRVSMHDAVLVIEILVEKFDFFEISESSASLREIIKNKSFPDLVFDLRRVRFIDSSVFGFLIEVRGIIHKNGNEVVLVCADPHILHTMDIMMITDMMKIVSEPEDAFACFNSDHTNSA